MDDFKIGDPVYIKTKNHKEQEFLGFIQDIGNKKINLTTTKEKHWLWEKRWLWNIISQKIDKESIKEIKLIQI